MLTRDVRVSQEKVIPTFFLFKLSYTDRTAHGSDSRKMKELCWPQVALLTRRREAALPSAMEQELLE